MPIQHTIHENLKIVVSVWTGPVTDKDLIPAYKKLYENKKWKPGFNEIADFRETDMSKVTDSGLMSLANEVKSYTKGKAHKLAIIAPKELPDTFAWFYEVYTSSTDSPEIAKIFYNLSDALKWFGSTKINKKVLGLKE